MFVEGPASVNHEVSLGGCVGKAQGSIVKGTRSLLVVQDGVIIEASVEEGTETAHCSQPLRSEHPRLLSR
jgi:hypothetical protein